VRVSVRVRARVSVSVRVTASARVRARVMVRVRARVRVRVRARVRVRVWAKVWARVRVKVTICVHEVLGEPQKSLLQGPLPASGGTSRCSQIDEVLFVLVSVQCGAPRRLQKLIELQFCDFAVAVLVVGVEKVQRSGAAALWHTVANRPCGL